ncbi:MAG TPA: hypothetical protein VGC26_04830 [Afipia sp.]
MLPKRGRIFRNGSGDNTPKVVYAKAIRDALRSELGQNPTANKTIQRWTGVGERTVKNWLNGQCGPRGEHLLLLACHSERVFETMLALADKDHVVADSNVQKICDEMTIAIGLMKRFLKHEKHSRSNQSVG